MSKKQDDGNYFSAAFFFIAATDEYYTEGAFKRSQMFKNIKMDRLTSKQLDCTY